jgi:hypothetical protein
LQIIKIGSFNPPYWALSVALEIAMKKPLRPLIPAFFAFLAIGFWLSEVTRCQEAALKDTASLASRQFAEKLHESVQSFATKQGVAIKNISIDVEGRPLAADLQRGLIEVPLIRYLQEQNFYSENSSELARIEYRFDPSVAGKPAKLRIELIELINTNTQEIRNIDECKELQTIIDRQSRSRITIRTEERHAMGATVDSNTNESLQCSDSGRFFLHQGSKKRESG